MFHSCFANPVSCFKASRSSFCGLPELRPEQQTSPDCHEREAQEQTESHQDHEHRKHACDIGRVMRLEDEDAEPIRGADELGDHHAEDAEYERYLETGENEGKR